MKPERLQRHQLVSLAPGAPDPLPDFVPQSARAAWQAADRPLIVRRGARDNGVPLGFPLPPDMGKARIGFCLPPQDLVSRCAPTLLALLPAAPTHWRGTLEAADVLARAQGIKISAFGALLWQALTGLAYLHPGSDLDLLWHCPARMPPGLPKAIATLDDRAPMRLDGEVVVDGCGVQWRELAMAGPSDPVFCRSTDGIAMRPASAFTGYRSA